MTVSDLPAINATLNGTSTLFLTLGFYFIKQGNAKAHRNCMVAAFLTSTIFLASYLVYHYNVGSTQFVNPAWFRPYYLILLFTHIVLAVAMLPLILMTFWHAKKRDFDKHKKIAKWAWPIWIYVSVTGVLVYLILYKIFPQE